MGVVLNDGVTPRSVIPGLLCLAACGPGAPPVPIEDAPVEVRVPAADDRGDDCSDAVDVRVCWHPECPDAVCAVPRPLPELAPAPRAGWRCHGVGAERRCVDRARRAGPFACEGDRCVQASPRLPDDGEWECFERMGAAICRRRSPSAGVVAGPADAGWICGEHLETGQPICVDPSPDLPEGDDRGWACHYERGKERVCERDPAAPELSRACDDGQACPRGTRCAAGRCLPRRLAPQCWFDEDCGDRAPCRLATCVGPAR